MGYTTNLPSDYFALGIQSAKDTEASSFFFFRQGSGTGLDVDEDVVSMREGGDGQEVGFRYKSLLKADGAVAGLARSELANVCGAAVLGKTATKIDGPSWSIATLATGMAVFRYVPNATLPWLTAEQRYSDQIERGTNMKGANLEINLEAGRAAQVSVQLQSAGTVYRRDIASTLTATRESADPAFFPRGTYVIDGVGNAKITKAKITAQVNLDDGIQTVDLWREDLLELTRDFTVDFTLKYESATFYNKIKYALGSQVPINLATGSFRAYCQNGQLTTATTFRAIDVTLPQLVYVGAKINKLEPDGQTVYLDVSAQPVKGATDTMIYDVVGASRAALV